MAKLYDRNGNALDIGGTAKTASILNGADVHCFGDSNVYYSYGHDLGDIGSIYQRLSLEFSIHSWANHSAPGKNSYQLYYDFNTWATNENVEAYNKETTIFLFGCGTNDELSSFSAEYTGNLGSCTATDGIHAMHKLLVEKFPKAQYHWIIPTETDWSKWTGSSDPDARNMAEKMPYIIKRLEECQFPYCDMYHTSGITSEMLSDGIHLGGGGYDYTTDAVYKYYRRLREYLINK